MDVIQQNIGKIKCPLGGEKVYKDECAYSFDNPESENGLYICMNTFLGLGKSHVERHWKKTGNQVYLNLKRRRIEIPKDDQPPEKKPTKMAIGVEGGFHVDDKSYRFEEETSIVVLPNWTVIPFPNTELPDLVQLSAATILTAEDAWKMEEAAAMACTWEGEKLRVSKHADNLKQLDNGKKIPPKGWKCERCDLTTNLWLNLTDGSILCGRKFFDGSGGNNHAVEAYEQTRFPLAVKLGTITAAGGDVYSYDEDEMVEDPHLAKHLAHFGINIAALKKTDKSMVELEIDLNQKIGEWDVIQESGSKLQPLYGPGFTGMRNLGNSCYMNSVMQVVFTIPDFQNKYSNKVEEIFNNCNNNPPDNFNVQMAKLGHGLLSGDYSKPPIEQQDSYIQPPTGIRPQMFKSLIGRGHPEFASKRQQDAQEYFLHLISTIEKSSRGQANPTDCFRFEVEERTECCQSKKVQYKRREDYCLSLPVPLEAVTNKEEAAAYEEKKKELQASGKTVDPKDIVRRKLSLNACIESFASPGFVEDFYSSAIQAKTTAQLQTRLASFPDYLLVHLQKFTVDETWTPLKLDMSVDVPDVIDISHLRGKGLQTGEEELPEVQAAPPQVNIDESVVNQLVEMGFDREGCRKAVYNTQNQGVEAAMNWVMEHMGDPDFTVPLQLPGSTSNKTFVPNDEALTMIMAMGFTRDQSIKALKATDNNIERAANWIFSHADELDEPMETENTDSTSNPQQKKFRDGNGKYQLVAFISHMGTSTSVGHYVCHIYKDGQWAIFNDEKVAKSEKPPRDLAYLYLYKRI
ncbi:hypothetical protein LOTGIDRAFT_238331 [Lottia gigantea]|uniref:Ubiquitin carboxyl-terminal hydrolase n=1 Tax=Lottia gigantea TaxID=225164 RepID=V4AUZ0_LOTGI|nr:hypothetical protein LOTGIDRAFT_238331 [Lottia gigantea]ESP01113.1 hypothetical protein LOTGIDRAFT_238331 [Lottia gigantea]